MDSKLVKKDENQVRKKDLSRFESEILHQDRGVTAKFKLIFQFLVKKLR